MSKIISNKTVYSSMLWVAIEKFGYSGLYFLSTILLARMLSPEDYGLIGLLAIFISISQMIVESGLGGALVKKHEPSDVDFSTIFTFNLFVSVFLYIILFFSAASIADYYDKPILSDIIRVLGIIIVINAFTLVQRVHLLRDMKFKVQSVISIISLSIATLSSFLMAYFGYGVWALVVQQVLYNLLFSVFVFIKVKYVPRILFSNNSFKELFGFGGRLFLSSIIQIAYNDIFAMIIAKAYDITTTGFYYQAKKLVDFPVSIFRALVDGAAFPILAKIIDKNEFLVMSSKINRGVLAISLPLLFAIPLFSESIILIVLGEKWKGSIPVLSILSYGSIALIMDSISRNIIKSSGRVDLLLKAEIVKKIIGFTILATTLNFGLAILLWGIVLNNVISYLINMLIVNKITLYSITKQMYDLLLFLVISILAAFAIYIIGRYFKLDLIFDFIVKGFIYLFIYMALGFIFKIKEFYFLLDNLKKLKNG